MSWLAPLGFLGLISLILLILIYIIKPNYQNKVISSTYVWKLSLKYRKRRLPINKLNNILIFLCQLLILTICSALLAGPVIAHEKIGDESERIIIIDASASMRVNDGKTSRFDRAVGEAELLAKATLDSGGIVSVILADDTPEFIIQRMDSSGSEDVELKFDELVEGEGRCSYSSADLEGAIALAEEVLSYNYEAQIHLFTATEYIEDNGVFIHTENIVVEEKEEWNAAVLGCTATIKSNNHYEISVELGCYGSTEQIEVFLLIEGANGNAPSKAPFNVPLVKADFFDPSEEEKTVTFTTDDFGGVPLYSYESIQAYIDVSDNMADDNAFTLYGGKKPTIRIQYASSIPNNYVAGAIRAMRQSFKGKWNIEYKELKADEAPALEGFDFYIFEHRMPTEMPKDGVVLLIDPSGQPEGSGIRFGQSFSVDSTSYLAQGAAHDLTKYIDLGGITIAKYTEVVLSDGYEELAYFNGRPVMLAKNEPDAKIVVWALDLHYSNIAPTYYFSSLMLNMFNYYIPSTLTSNSFEIGDTVDLTARGTELKVSGGDEEISFEGNRGQIVISKPGTYTVTQKPMEGDELIIDSFFVAIPNEESNITKQIDQVPPASVEIVTEIEFEDLLFYFAIALVALMFVEWMLQSKKNY